MFDMTFKLQLVLQTYFGLWSTCVLLLEENEKLQRSQICTKLVNQWFTTSNPISDFTSACSISYYMSQHWAQQTKQANQADVTCTFPKLQLAVSTIICICQSHPVDAKPNIHTQHFFFYEKWGKNPRTVSASFWNQSMCSISCSLIFQCKQMLIDLWWHMYTREFLFSSCLWANE